MLRLSCPHCAVSVEVPPAIGPAVCPACRGEFLLLALPVASTEDAEKPKRSWLHPVHWIERFADWAAPLWAKLVVAACASASLILVTLALLAMVRRALSGASLALFDELWWAFKALVGLLLCGLGTVGLMYAFLRAQRRRAREAELHRQVLEAELQAAEAALAPQPSPVPTPGL